jgi:hypothetical protein
VNDWIAVEIIDRGHEAILELLLGCDADVAQDGAGEFGKEALDEIEPGAVLEHNKYYEARRGLLARRECCRSTGGQSRGRVRQAVGSAEGAEVESGKRSDRPKLAGALKTCRALGATLIIAKLDRLARNVHFVSGLMESGVEFTAVDFPQANRLTVHILAAVESRSTDRQSKSCDDTRGKHIVEGHQKDSGGRVEDGPRR